jgi:hypothetical protein
MKTSAALVMALSGASSPMAAAATSGLDIKDPDHMDGGGVK